MGRMDMGTPMSSILLNLGQNCNKYSRIGGKIAHIGQNSKHIFLIQTEEICIFFQQIAKFYMQQVNLELICVNVKLALKHYYIWPVFHLPAFQCSQYNLL